MKRYILAVLVLLVCSSMAWGQASLTVEVYPEKFVKIGDEFWYNIQIRNTGDDIAYNVEVTPTFDSNITTAAAPVVVGNIAAETFYNMNIPATVDGSTTELTQMTSSFDVDYEDIGGTPYTTVTVEGKNRAYDDMEHCVDPSWATTDWSYHYDISPDGSKIIYDLQDDASNDDIYIINVDGTGKTQLTNDPGCETEPVFSPDGTKFLYKTNINQGTVPDATYDPNDDWNADIYVMDLATKANTQLTSDGDCQKTPSWSPDGTKILFTDDHLVKSGDDTYSRLWIMDADGSNQLEISSTLGGQRGEFTADGEWIFFHTLYQSTDTTRADIYKVKPDGTSLTQITTSAEDCENRPRISPDGTKLLIKHYYDDGTKGWHNAIALMDPDGSNFEIIIDEDPDTDNDAHQGYWSPDGRWILFGWDTMENDPDWWYQSLWVVDNRNRYKGNLSSGNKNMKWQWSPDGTYFAFVDDNSDGARTADMEDIWIFPLDVGDIDEDDLANWEEDVVGSDPAEFDTDGDTAGDGREFDQGSNPLVADCPGAATLTATAGDGLVELSWEAPAKSGAIASYTLFRSETAGGPYEELEAGIDGTTHTDDTVTNGTTYYYVVVAVDADEFMGGDSNEAEATPQAETDDDTGDDDTDDDVADDDAAGGDDDDDDDEGCCGC